MLDHGVRQLVSPFGGWTSARGTVIGVIVMTSVDNLAAGATWVCLAALAIA